MVCVGTGVYTGSTVTGGLCRDWSVSTYACCTGTVVCVRTGLSVHAAGTVIGDLCQNWFVNVCW